MSNLIQIKRSTTTATPTTLNAGELAYSNTAQVLYIGSTDGASVVPLAGTRNPGVLTANQALVANASSMIDKIIVANAAITRLTANGVSAPGAGYLLSVDGGGNTYWLPQSSVSINTAAQFAWTNTHTFSANVSVQSDTGVPTFVVGNTSAYSIANSTGHYPVSNTAGNALGSASNRWALNATTGSFAGAVSGITTLGAGNTTITGFANVTSSIQGGGSLTIAGAASGITTLAAGNTTITGFANVTSSIQGGGSLTIAGAASGITTLAAGNTTITGFANVSGSIQGGAGLTLAGAVSGVTTLAAGNTTITGFANVTTTLAAGNTTITGYALAANGFIATSGWSGTQVDGIVVDYTTGTGRIMVGQNDGVTFYSGNATNVGANVYLMSVSNTGAVNATSYSVGTSFVANSTAITGQGGFVANGSVLAYTGANVNFGSSTVNLGNTTITGNLTVTGTITTVDTVNLTVTDSLIRLAQGQANTTTYTDAVDIGFYGVYGNTTSTKYAGIARDSVTQNFILFKDQTLNPDNASVDSTNTTTTPIATLITYLTSGGLTSNAGSVAITANSTVNVAIVANTLTLSTALAATSGGTGLNTYTTGDIIYASGTNTLAKLAAGTNGYVLQMNGSGVPSWNTLDGGTF